MSNQKFTCVSRTVSVGTSSSYGNVEYKASNFDDITSFFGLYDGQEENAVAKFCAKYLHEEIKRIEDSLKAKNKQNDDDDYNDLRTAIKDGFLRMDEMMKDPSFWRELNGEGISYESEEELEASLDLTGSQACVVLVRNDNLVVANVGLSGCLISRKDKCFGLTTEHRPNLREEKKRIDEAKGFVSFGRVRFHKEKSASALDFSRAIGYMRFKQNEELSPLNQIIIAKPVVRKVELRQDIEFIILAPKEFWILMKKQDAMEHARIWIQEGLPLSEVCQKLHSLYLTMCSTGQSRPNIMVIIIQLDVPLSEVPMLQSQVPEEDSNKFFKQRSVVNSVQDPENWKRLNKTYILARDREPAEVLEMIRVARLMSAENGNDDGPSFTLPSRADKLYHYIPELQQLCLCRGKTYLSRSVEKNKYMEAIMATVEDLLERKDKNTVRCVSYRVEKVCDHEQSDDALREVCLMLESNRTSLNVFGTPTGSICGPIVLIDNETRIDCEGGGLSCMRIPIDAERGEGITGVESKRTVKYILVIEKETAFLILRDLDFQIRNQCVLVTGGGTPDIATRIVVSKLEKFLKVPAYCFVDANPFGIRIFSTYKYGSKQLAFDNLGLTAPSLKLIGLSPDDITNLPKSSRKVLSVADMTCLNGLLERKYVMEDETLNQYLNLMESNRYKAQIECLQEAMGSAGLVQYIEEKIAEVHPQDT